MAQPDNNSTTETQALTSPQVVAQFDSGLKQIAESLVAIRDGFSSIEKDLEVIPGAQAVVFSRDWKDLRQVESCSCSSAETLAYLLCLAEIYSD